MVIWRSLIPPPPRCQCLPFPLVSRFLSRPKPKKPLPNCEPVAMKSTSAFFSASGISRFKNPNNNQNSLSPHSNRWKEVHSVRQMERKASGTMAPVLWPGTVSCVRFCTVKKTKLMSSRLGELLIEISKIVCVPQEIISNKRLTITF